MANTGLTHVKGAIRHLPREGKPLQVAANQSARILPVRTVTRTRFPLSHHHTMHFTRITLLTLSLTAASCATVASETLEVPPALGQLESKTYVECMKKANGRLEQAPCIQHEKSWQYQQLELLYKSLATKLNDSQRKELAKSQAAWKAFVSSETAFAASVYYPQLGSSDLSVSTNEIMWVVQRRQQLQQHLDLN